MRLSSDLKRFLFFSAILMSAFSSEAQSFDEQLTRVYEQVKEDEITHRRFKHEQILKLLQPFNTNPDFEVRKVGASIEGRDLHLVSFGSGDTDVFLWSQMHGDESTATMALFDLLNFFNSDLMAEERQEILTKLRIHFLPMLNPDGAEVFERRNALGIDINRDAISLQSPESQTLKRVRDSLEADFGFNLHDQSVYYNAERTSKPATISFLAPAYNYEKEVNTVRERAMKLIVGMNTLLQKYAPGQVGRYNDDFEPRAFGDNIQKWGTSTVLIESGGYPEDPEKQEIRKLNFIIIGSALHQIASGDYMSLNREAYFTIPENDRKLFDLKITNLAYELLGSVYTVDLGLHRFEQDGKGSPQFHYTAGISDQGDLSTYFGYEEFDAAGYEMVWAKKHDEPLSQEQWERMDVLKMLRQGIGYITLEKDPGNLQHTGKAMHVVPADFKPVQGLRPGVNPVFFLKKGEDLKFAVLNGFLIDLSKDQIPEEVNGLFL